MAQLSEEAKLADEVSAHCGISTNATLRVFYALKALGYHIEFVGDSLPKLKGVQESKSTSQRKSSASADAA